LVVSWLVVSPEPIEPPPAPLRTTTRSIDVAPDEPVQTTTDTGYGSLIRHQWARKST
jgi:hypothetical protein